MGRTRTKAKVHTKVTDPPPIHSNATKNPSVDALLEKAQSLVAQCDYDLAIRFAKRILQQNPDHPEGREILGVALLETGEIADAKLVFESLVPPSQNAPAIPPPSAYLYLAQLSEDDPTAALKHYGAAVSLLSAQLKGKDRAPPASTQVSDEVEVKGNIVRALVGQVEIWMDPSYDLCFEPQAEKTCQDLLTLALQTDPGNPEALLALASVRMSQQRSDDARQCLEQSWSAWKDLDPDDQKVPLIPVRLSMVKLFIELALYTPALLVLQGIMSSDDQDPEAWYLEGWCFYLMSEQAKESGGKIDDLTWEDLAKDARDCLDTCQMLHRNQDHPDKPLLQHTLELISKLEELGIKPSPFEDGEDEDGDGDWESDDDSTDSDGDVDMQ